MSIDFVMEYESEREQVDPKSHKGLEHSRSFAREEQVNGKYQGPQYRGHGDDDEGCGPFRYSGPSRGYSAGK